LLRPGRVLPVTIAILSMFIFLVSEFAEGHWAHRERRTSRLKGPAPNCEISNAPPSTATFFMNMTICNWAIIGS